MPLSSRSYTCPASTSEVATAPPTYAARAVFNAAGGIIWATVFGTGGYLLGEGIRRIAGPVGWALLALAVVFGFVFWRYYKKHEEALLAKAEREMVRQV